MVEYTKLSEAIDALEARRHLRPKVEAFLRERGVGLPWDPALENGKPLAVLFRQVATPNYETLRFLSIASGFDMQPVILEYTEDRLSMENLFKKSLVCLPLVEKISVRGHVQFRKHWFCPPDTVRPQSKLSEVPFGEGRTLVDFHHQLFDGFNLSGEGERIDASAWFANFGRAADYYPSFLSLFCAHAILFENFSEKGVEENFTKFVAAPGFAAATEAIGVTPLVVPISPTETEDSNFWFCYPKEASQNEEWILAQELATRLPTNTTR